MGSGFSPVTLTPSPTRDCETSFRDIESDKNRLAWQACWFMQCISISQLWMSLACEQIAIEALKKSFNLSDRYQENKEHEHPYVQTLFPPGSGSVCPHHRNLFGSHFNKGHCLFLDKALYSLLRWHAKIKVIFYFLYIC